MDVDKILGIANNAITLVQKVSDVNGVKAKMESLKMNMGMVSARKADISFELGQEERTSGKKRKKEVDFWMQSVASLEDQVHELGRKVKEGHFFSHLMLEEQVRGLEAQVEKLHEKGRFDNGLMLDVKLARGYELQRGEQVGQASQTKRAEIWDCLMNEEVLRVGVWGQWGVGKTSLVKHIHDQIVRDRRRFDGACLVRVSQEGTVGMIQTDIANYLKLDLTDVSGVCWGARLKEALQDRKILLILDDVWKYYSLEELGIALERNGCKLIMTSRSSDVCEQMNCNKHVHVTTLPEEEAWCLFTKNLNAPFLPDIEDVARAVAKECGGFPLAIVVLSGVMRGKRHIHQWRNALRELQNLKFTPKFMKDDVFRVLTFSYHRLDLTRRECFSQVALYPEDHRVSKRKRVQYITDSKINGIEEKRQAQLDKGHTTPDELVDACLLEAETNGTGSRVVKKHDLSKDMAIDMANGEVMVKAGLELNEVADEPQWKERLKKVPVFFNKIGQIGWLKSSRRPKISTLLVDISDSFFKHMKALTT
ncbi:hypothetical protein ACJRO7_023135 [Eucalyptus globulus]|uniref:NB-ARC domain-containing protein n=1 Tax=Eucalyptus globulus TaxID=34317 RepID=A0ABD3K1C3_EUCGL